MKKSSDQTIDLPAGFRFCVSTAAHQIEGSNFHSDWWHFEQIPGNIKNGHTSEFATDSWNHVDEDIRHIKALGVDTYRFSIEWAKIEPKCGEFNHIEINRYAAFIHRLKLESVEPMVTLYHFTLPQWVSEKGGWEWEGIADAFNEFVKKVVDRIGNAVTLWITLNEPMSIIAAGYLSNVFPPAKNDIKSIGLPMANMIRAHAKAYHTLHAMLDGQNFKPRVALAHHLRIFDPHLAFHPLDRYLARKFDEIFNWAIPNALQTGHLKFSLLGTTNADFFIPEAIKTEDFFGLNYYSRDIVSLNLFQNPKFSRKLKADTPITELGWEIYPKGLGRLLTTLSKKYPHLPVWITENGLADQVDLKRMDFIKSHLAEVSLAIKKGARVEGYCHWTLNDNFEWAEGYTAFFGFYEIEKGTRKRIARPSAQLFAELIKGLKHKHQLHTRSSLNS